MRSLLLPLLLIASAAPGTGRAQEDELIAPLVPDNAPRPKPPQDDDLLAPLHGPTELVITLSEPITGAKLYVDDKEQGPLDGKPIEVTPGEHRIVVKRPGFQDYSVTASVASGRREKVPVSLNPTGAVLAVQPNVPAAEVYLDDQLVGRGKVEALVVKPGVHELRVEKAGYLAEVTRLSLRAGKDYTVAPMLIPALTAEASSRASTGGPELAPKQPAKAALAPAGAPLLSQWYFWAGVGLVAAAAGGTTYAVVSRPATVTPDQVCGGPCDGTVNAPGRRQRPAGFLLMLPAQRF